jgi:hypothetical protein
VSRQRAFGLLLFEKELIMPTQTVPKPVLTTSKRMPAMVTPAQVCQLLRVTARHWGVALRSTPKPCLGA